MVRSDTPTYLCTHLTAGSPDEYFVWFTGRGTECTWVCPECEKTFPSFPESVVEATPALVEKCMNEAAWEGICGTPEIKSRATTLRFDHWESEALPHRGQWIDIQPDSRSDHWLVLLASGDVGVLSPHNGRLNFAFRLSEGGFDLDDEAELCVSPFQDWAAVYRASGQRAIVFDLKSGNVTARIDRGTYRPENSHFPIAFFQCGEQTLLAAATAWNRLEAIRELVQAASLYLNGA